MDWQDDEFETFLRQFRPCKPKALPTHRRTIVAFAIAATLVVAAVVPMRLRTMFPAERAPQTSQSTSPATSKPTNAMNPDGQVGQAPAPARRGDARQPSPLASSGSANASNSLSSRRIRVGGAIRPPRKLVNLDPVYPEDARTAGIEGIVVLDIVIGGDGSVIQTQVVRSIAELEQAAIDAVMQWKFEPTLLNGEPVEVQMNVAINFTLR